MVQRKISIVPNFQKSKNFKTKSYPKKLKFEEKGRKKEGARFYRSYQEVMYCSVLLECPLK